MCALPGETGSHAPPYGHDIAGSPAERHSARPNIGTIDVETHVPTEASDCPVRWRAGDDSRLLVGHVDELGVQTIRDYRIVKRAETATSGEPLLHSFAIRMY
jgi:hypothetical protein